MVDPLKTRGERRREGNVTPETEAKVDYGWKLCIAICKARRAQQGSCAEAQKFVVMVPWTLLKAVLYVPFFTL